MARFRLSGPAQADLSHILKTSADRWGAEGRRRYRAILTAAMRTVASDPQGPNTHSRTELLPGLRSIHVRHARGTNREVRAPVHVLYYRAIASDLIEIVRVLHERMEPSRHIAAVSNDQN